MKACGFTFEGKTNLHGNTLPVNAFSVHLKVLFGKGLKSSESLFPTNSVDDDLSKRMHEIISRRTDAELQAHACGNFLHVQHLPVLHGLSPSLKKGEPSST